MPFYRFQVDVNAPPQVVLDRLKSIVGPKPGFWESMTWTSRGSATVPFIGAVQDDSFSIHRDIRYRNSFLPLIRGRIMPTGTATRVSVTMFIHPFVAVFMLFWLGMVVHFALISPAPLIPGGMFLAGVAMTLGGFFPEAFKARRLICEAVDAQGSVPLPLNT